MIDFLNDLGINNTTIMSIEEKYNEYILYNLSLNKFEIEKIIRYFKEIGINNIDDILISNIELFFKTYREIKRTFISLKNINELVEKINEDAENIYLLFEND